jgi:hypothetical protein
VRFPSSVYKEKGMDSFTASCQVLSPKFERLKTKDRTSYYVHALIFQWELRSYIHGHIIENVHNVVKLYCLLYSQCRCSYHKKSCAVISLIDRHSENHFLYYLVFIIFAS